jgi:MFS family permease
LVCATRGAANLVPQPRTGGLIDHGHHGIRTDPLRLDKELGLTAEAFGFGVGIFFFGYFIFEVPSNLVLEKTGARRWIARIMVSWGVISVSFAFVPAIAAMLQSAGLSFFDSVRTFYLMRFIFGAAEAGFFPGIILYLTYWFTGAERARWVGLFMVANPLSTAIGGPISGLILDAFDGVAGLGGWQWLFIIEGIPAVLVGLWVLSYLTDRPKEAAWLEPDERTEVQYLKCGRDIQVYALTPKGGPPALPGWQQKFDVYGGRPLETSATTSPTGARRRISWWTNKKPDNKGGFIPGAADRLILAGKDFSLLELFRELATFYRGSRSDPYQPL